MFKQPFTGHRNSFHCSGTQELARLTVNSPPPPATPSPPPTLHDDSRKVQQESKFSFLFQHATASLNVKITSSSMILLFFTSSSFQYFFNISTVCTVFVNSYQIESNVVVQDITQFFFAKKREKKYCIISPLLSKFKKNFHKIYT